MDSKIKLLRISTVPHSFHLLLKGQLKHMSENGFEVSIASADGWEVSEIENREKVKHFTIPFTRKMNPVKDFIALIALIKLIRKLNPQIVHTHSPKAGTLGMLAAWICRSPIKVHTIAGLPLMEARGFMKWLLVNMERFTYTISDWVLPNSIVQANYILTSISRNVKPKLHVVGKGSSNGIDLKYFDRTKSVLQNSTVFEKEHNISAQTVVLSFVGRIVPYKGIYELVEAFKRLQNENRPVKLLLVGPYEQENPLDVEVKEEIENNEHIIVTGYVEDIRPYLAASDIFVFPSYREGFPQSLMQAVAMGLPCIASDINGCNEIIFDQENGFLIPAKNTQSIVDRVQQLIDDPQLRVRMSANGRNYQLEHFEQKKLWNKMVEFYQEKLKNI